VLGTGCGWQLERHSKMTVAVVVDEAKRQLVLVVGCTCVYFDSFGCEVRPIMKCRFQTEWAPPAGQ
jgi:hypothetical protein